MLKNIHDYVDSVPTQRCNLDHIVGDIYDIIQAKIFFCKMYVTNKKNVCSSQNNMKPFLTVFFF